ncbi:MAG: FtsB family cell division protein [Chitinispirillaceae bacterium]
MKKRNIITIGVCAIAGIPLLVILIGGNQGFLDLYKSHREVNKTSAQIEAARKMRDSLALEKNKLLKDTAYLEKIAREKLGMAKESEKIYKFVKEKR